MSEKYSGLQARTKEKCEFAISMACAAYSLNLMGLHADEYVQDTNNCFSNGSEIEQLFFESWSSVG